MPPDDPTIDTRAATEALGQVAAAVTGPGTPDHATVTTGTPRRLVWALVLAGPAVSLMIIGLALILAYKFWPDSISVEQYDISKTIVGGLITLINILAFILGLITFRLASGGLKSVRAQALGGNIEVATGQD